MLTLALLSVLMAQPMLCQIPNIPMRPDRYVTEGHKDVSRWVLGEDDAVNLCNANCSLGQESGKSITTEWSGSLSRSITLAQAISMGLSFGLAVSTEKSTVTTKTMHCNAENHDCVCGMIYKVDMEEAWGKRVVDLYYEKRYFDFRVQAPRAGAKGQAVVHWDLCRSSRSSATCAELQYMPCPDGM